MEQFQQLSIGKFELGPGGMISQIRSVKMVLWPRSLNSPSTLAENSRLAMNHVPWTRLVQVILALYLIPAVLVVFLVGVLGIIIVKAAKIIARLQGRATS